MMSSYQDQDPQETQEWLDALEAVIAFEGTDKAQQLIAALIDTARKHGIDTPYSANTPYINTIPREAQPPYPGDLALERRLRALIRWNAMAMVVKANKMHDGIGGHLGSFASSATLYEVGQNHFFKGPEHPDGADLVFFQGHVSPGMYARAYLEGRLSEDQLLHFRQEVDGKGISSYPHPWLMRDFWQFPTVSMGLGPLMAVYQARFMKYMHARGLISAGKRKVWAFLGDGEMDEPEAMGGIGLAAREGLDNLIFVINCNLQRLDGPVRGNGKIIQELESHFRGVGWNVYKVIWGSNWDELLARDTSGKLMQRMMEVVDGEYQSYAGKNGAYVREHFFGKYPETLKLVEHMTDDEIFALSRGGHSPRKLFAAYKAASESQGKPSVILAKTIKGYGMGPYGEASMAIHQQKKLDLDGLKYFRDRFSVPISDEQLEKDIPFYRPEPDSEVMQYLLARRKALGGYLPTRRDAAPPLPTPPLSLFETLLQSTGDRGMSTTMAFGRLLAALLRDQTFGKRVVPIIPDEARTFGLEGLFRQVGIYDPAGQLYEPIDANQVMWYKQAANGQVLEEGITEAGAISSWIAASTAYANHGVAMVPFYIYYSMFGYQRVGDLVWAAGDIQARGFLMGATAGRTTLMGEGLQHQDGHNLLAFGQVPNCLSYDPSFAYELAVIVHEGLRRMLERRESVFYYITLMNENYPHPPLPEGIEDGILKGLYRIRASTSGHALRAQLLGSGTILREALAAAEMLEDEWGVAADVWSATSFNLLHRDGMDCTRWNTRHPQEEARVPYVTQCLAPTQGPIVAATDYVRAIPEQVRAYLPGKRYLTLGTDGFGRSDTREALRRFFEVDRWNIVLATLKALADEGAIPAGKVGEAIAKYGLDADKPNPMTV